ncbi:unnamed protein product [Prorocentrum cordatum]|uniref:Exostosin GT47 domain-containing protein n=1 Tax=Prorocentrum cordatum TaxID=2364126 RepID=A0ABN9WK29_9DINO|nr:unnamed protein product [Polarella glacialis]
MTFMGSFKGNAPVRQRIVDQCNSYKDPFICSAHHKVTKASLAEARNSKFCLRRAGDSPSRKSIVDVIALGCCIPVFFHPAHAKLYEINWDGWPGWSACVSIPRREFLNGGINLHRHLAAIRKAEVQSMQYRLFKNAPTFQCQLDDNGQDQPSNLLGYLQKKSVQCTVADLRNHDNPMIIVPTDRIAFPSSNGGAAWVYFNLLLV